MIKQIKIGVGGYGFWLAKPAASLGHLRFFQIVLVFAAMLQFQSMGQAQGNLVDLYNWTDDSTPFKGFVHIGSSNSSIFVGNYNDEGGFNDLILAGSLNTTPGTTYEINFTLQDESPNGDDGGAGSLLFGNHEISLDYTFLDSYLSNGAYVFPAVNYDFTAMATSSTTTMSFYLTLDEGLNVALSDLSITEVPELSTFSTFLYGGCFLFLGRQLQRVFQRRKLAVNG